MNDKDKEQGGRDLLRRWVEHIALWQYLSFFTLLLFVWVNELYDLPAILFDYAPSPMNVSRACLVSAVVILVGIMTIVNTYLQQKYVIKGFLVVCACCKKMKIDHVAWDSIEGYIKTHSLAVFTHGICPECYHTVTREAEKVEKTVKREAVKGAG